MSPSYPKIYLYKRIVQAKLFIDDHFSEQIELSQVADEACFSKFHFIRLFKAAYGRTPHQYLMKVRIENAKDLLREGRSVTDTCFSVGFDSVSSFTGLFRRFAKCSPSLFQRQQLLRKQLIKTAPLYFIPNCFAEKKGWSKKSNFQEVL
jgi:AraC-like DNA-binding protein